MSAQHDITEENLRSQNYRPIHAGDDYDHTFVVDRPPGTDMDLTSALIWCTIKANTVETDAQALLQLRNTAAGGSNAEIEITSASEGKFTIKFRGSGANSTENIAGLHLYDIQVKLGSGTLITIAKGKIEFLENITRSIT